MQSILESVPADEQLVKFIDNDTSSSASRPSFAATLADRAWATSAVLEDILDRKCGYPHWGIND